jgi:hypothetical protein
LKVNYKDKTFNSLLDFYIQVIKVDYMVPLN